MATTAPTAHDSGHAAGHEDHERTYWAIFVVLVVLTALEVSTYYVSFGKALLPVLFVLMSVKFLLVVLYFMHLKFDASIFSKLFWSGFALAILVYLVTLTTFQFWIA